MNPTHSHAAVDRRSFLARTAGAAAAAALAPFASTQSTHAQGFPIGPEPMRYPSSVWKVLDERFRKYMVANTPLVREWTGALWAEGPAWNGVGRYVVFSDIPHNRQMRWDEATGTVSVLRAVSNFSNGNTFDWQGRQVTCVHPEGGGIIFSDPGYGSHGYYEGGLRELELPTSVYHIDPQTKRLTKLTDEIQKPNGVCFSPNYRILYVADTAPTHYPNEKAKIIAWDVQDNGRRLTNRRVFVTQDAGIHDGIRADVDGNIWCGTGFGGEGVDGVHVYAADGKKIGQIVMPEGTANLCFVGKNRNRLFITSSQSVYTLYTGAQGAHIT
jgi:gluconolactonase